MYQGRRKWSEGRRSHCTQTVLFLCCVCVLCVCVRACVCACLQFLSPLYIDPLKGAEINVSSSTQSHTPYDHQGSAHQTTSHSENSSSHKPHPWPHPQCHIYGFPASHSLYTQDPLLGWYDAHTQTHINSYNTHTCSTDFVYVGVCVCVCVCVTRYHAKPTWTKTEQGGS